MRALIYERGVQDQIKADALLRIQIHLFLYLYKPPTAPSNPQILQLPFQQILRGFLRRPRRMTHQPLADSKIIRSGVRSAVIVVFVDDGMDEDGLLVDCDCGVCGDGYPIICLVVSESGVKK